MIAPQHDRGAVEAAGGIEFGEQPSDLGIGVGQAGQIALHEDLGLLHVSGFGMAARIHQLVADEGGNAAHVVAHQTGHLNAVQRIKVEILLWHHPVEMRLDQTDVQHEGAGGIMGAQEVEGGIDRDMIGKAGLGHAVG